MKTADQEKSEPHMLLHVPTNQWLCLWIDGWYLVQNEKEATTFYHPNNSTDRLIPMLEKLFNGQVEMFFLKVFPNGNRRGSTTQLKIATG